MAAKIINNFGSGVVVNDSSNIKVKNIHTYANDFIDFNILSKQLDILLNEYTFKEAEDSYGIKAIEIAKECAKSNDNVGLKQAIRKFNGCIVDLVKELALNILSEYILNNLR